MTRFLNGLMLVLAVTTPSYGKDSDGVSALIGSLRPGEPVKHKNLTVFPLRGNATGKGEFVPLDRAIREELVQVTEKDGGDVNTVRVRNESDRYVFGMAGEIVTGAKQNRMLQKDVLLPPKSGWLELPVYCVEHGRWHGASAEFSSKGQIAAGRVRGKAANTESQSEVWAEVDANNADLGVVSPTQRFDAVFDDRKVQERLGDYKSNLERKVPRLAPDAIGVAVAVGDRLVCIDVFSCSGFFRKLWPRLLESYVVDAISQEPSGSMSRTDVNDYLAAARKAETVSQATVGAGRLVRIEGTELTGSALLLGNEVVHLEFFPSETAGSPLRLDIRRQGLERGR